MPRPRISSTAITATPATVLTEMILDLADVYHISPESPNVSAALVAAMSAYRKGHTLNEAIMMSRIHLLHSTYDR
jgi:hypothetical protein